MVVFVALLIYHTDLGLIASIPPYQLPIDFAFDVRNEIDIC